jgi:hypothetical protein
VGRTVRHARKGFDADPDDPAVVIRREAQLLVNYRNSPLIGNDAEGGAPGGPLPGDRAPDCRGLRRAAVNHPLRLFELLADPHHTLLLYTDDTDQLPAFRRARGPRRHRDRGTGKDLHHYCHPRPSGPRVTGDRGRSR